MTFGENLKHIRKEKKMTQAELGNRVGMSASAVGQFEQYYTKVPRRETVEKFAEALNVSPMELDSGLNVSSSDKPTIVVQEGSAEYRAFSLLRTMNKQAVDYWMALGYALVGFPENRRA